MEKNTFSFSNKKCSAKSLSAIYENKQNLSVNIKRAAPDLHVKSWMITAQMSLFKFNMGFAQSLLGLWMYFKSVKILTNRRLQT